VSAGADSEFYSAFISIELMIFSRAEYAVTGYYLYICGRNQKNMDDYHSKI